MWKTWTAQLRGIARVRYFSTSNVAGAGETTLPKRIVPKLPTFYSANPVHENNINKLESLLRKYIKLPTTQSLLNSVSTGSSPTQITKDVRPPWLSFEDYKNIGGGSRLKPTQYAQLVYLLNKIHNIDPQLTNEEIKTELAVFYKVKNLNQEIKRQPSLDEFGRSVAIGRRKTSSAKVYVVRGTGEILVNGRPLNNYFVSLKDRQSIMYPLQVIEATAKYNVFATTSGGGPTGQAEAIMLAIGKALIAFNPLLKSRLHKAGVLTRDTRRVERKKPGKLKARKMPAWVKR